ncbi:MAG: HDOD domain-containing protein [Hahellaceae bacterium]|nr:HDOD domain-containing protein [Hahellaceae bacterium]
MPLDQILLARQPIYNPAKSVIGYELLFRSEVAPEKFDGNLATSQVLLNAYTESTIEEVTGGQKAFVNFTRELLLQPPPFSPEHLTIEILEDIEPDAAVLAAVADLKRKGFTLAMDDYVPGTRSDAFLPFVDIVKLELPAIAESRLPEVIRQLKQQQKKLLAEKIETHEEFQRCVDLGCDMFQGYFLSKPQVVKGRKLPQNKMAVMQLIATMQNPALSIAQVIDIITRDPSLAFKLLQLVNSAAFRRSRKIESIHMAVMMLGISRIKAWATLLALTGMDDKPAILVNFALTRARMCELLAQSLEPEAADAYFTIGLFSCLEAFFDLPVAEILQKLPLEERITDALTRMKGKPGLALHTTIQYERCNLEGIHWSLLKRFALSPTDISHIYQQCIQWLNEQDLPKS